MVWEWYTHWFHGIQVVGYASQNISQSRNSPYTLCVSLFVFLLRDWVIVLLGVCLLYELFVVLFALVGSEWCLLFLFPTLENGGEGSVVKLCFKFQSLQSQWHQELPSKPSWCLLLHLSLSIMHVFTFEVLQKDLIQTKTIFCCGYYYYCYYY